MGISKTLRLTGKGFLTVGRGDYLGGLGKAPVVVQDLVEQDCSGVHCLLALRFSNPHKGVFENPITDTGIYLKPYRSSLFLIVLR